MPIYDFECSDCDFRYQELTKFDKQGKYPDISCPKCKSKKKEKLISMCGFAFGDPVGTDRWTSDGHGHDYRFQHNIPNLKEQRAVAEATSHMGNPYANDTTFEKDLELGEGIHDPEFRSGLS